MALFIGLMSGTSMDGIDAALVRLDTVAAPQLLATHTEPLPATLLAEVLALSRNHGNPEAMGRCDQALGECFARAAQHLAVNDSLQEPITAIGSHGQTVWHQPNGDTPFSIQLGDPNVIAERTGITTVADFRRRDIAAGGQGAPLVPAFHHAAFSSDTENRVLVNIGGIANVSLLPAGAPGATGGFDTGPGNGLMDAWCYRHTGNRYDLDGRWARTGRLQQELLNRLLATPYFVQPPPKSTGKELFNLQWLDSCLTGSLASLAPEDVQRTLLELTVETITRQLPDVEALALYVCGGGAHNKLLMERLRRRLEPAEIAVRDTGALGIDADWVEAAAFGWLAQQALAGLPGNVPAVTGARGPRILGGIYPA